MRATLPPPSTPPRQVLSTRARKDVALSEVKVQVVIYAFDALFVNGRSLLACPLTERREALYGALQEQEGELAFATAKISKDVEELGVGGGGRGGERAVGGL